MVSELSDGASVVDLTLMNRPDVPAVPVQTGSLLPRPIAGGRLR